MRLRFCRVTTLYVFAGGTSIRGYSTLQSVDCIIHHIMSFLRYKRTIEEGDVVIVYKGKQDALPLEVTPGEVLQVKGGAIPHSHLVGKKYGTKVYTTNGKAWVCVVHPTPELWTVTLPHRTQIVYSVDISVVLMQLELRPGSVVCECGTGSGSVSHAIARTVAPHGHLYTFEFHKQRAETAHIEFASHKLDKIITVTHRDVCEEGFNVESTADAVFLDLPEPWRAVDTSREAIKKSGGRLGSFSPCIEQVQRTCDKLRESGFVAVEVMECLLRPYEVRNTVMVTPNLGPKCDPVAMKTEADPSLPHSMDTSSSRSTSVSGRMEMVTGQPLKSIAGHTGYLIFATLNPKVT